MKSVPSVALKLIDTEQVATNKEMREFVKRSDSLVRVLFDNIVVRKGFNLRTDFGDLEGLAASIEAEGLKVPLTVDVMKDGTAILTDGERRFRAVQMLREKSKELKDIYEYLDVLLNDKKANEADRIVSMMVHNSGKPFEPLEEAEGYRRLRDDHKLNLPQISARVGKPIGYIEQRLILAGLDVEEQDEIRTKKISATAKVEQVRKEKDPVKRKAQVKESAARGKKVKVKDIKSVPMAKKVDEILALVKQADKKNKDAVIQNLLFEIDSQLRKLKAGK